MTRDQVNWAAWIVGGALVGCGGGGTGDSASATDGTTGEAPTTAGASTSTTSGASGDETAAPTTSGASGDASTSSSTAAPTSSPTTDAASAGDTSGDSTEGLTGDVSTTDAASSSGTTEAAENLPPEITSDPNLELFLQVALGGKFEPGQLFLASSVTRTIRVYDAATLAFVQSFTHPLFNEAPFNPRGMAFNERGNLVVATFTTFIEFSDYGVVDKTYPKKDAEATENVIFDALGNLYTTTATGGTDRLNQYLAKDYSFVQTIKGPPGAGQYTGITFDDQRRLYLASQSDNKIHVAQADDGFSTFQWIQTLPAPGPAVRLEGLVFNSTGELIVAQADLLRYDVAAVKVAGSFDVPQNVWPVPVSVDNTGRIYTADFEDGVGSKSADIVRFDPDGTNPLTINDPNLFGPFGLAISGTVLVSDPPVLYTYAVQAVDPEGGPLTFALVTAPEGMTIDPQTGVIEWWVTSKQLGMHAVEVQVQDDQGLVDTQAFTVEIKAL